MAETTGSAKEVSNTICVAPESTTIQERPQALFSQKDIAPDGDVILVVGTGDDTVRLRVSSHILKAASPVFATMFSPNWLEGKNLSHDSPKDVQFPEDDPGAMYLACQVAHLQYIVGAYQPCPSGICSLVLLADKYDMVRVVEPYIHSWLSRPVVSTLDRMYFFAAATYIDESLHINWRWTIDLVCKHDGPFATFLDCPILQKLIRPADISRLEDIRAKVRLDLMDLLFADSWDCGCNERFGNIALRLIQLRTTYKPSQFSKFPITGICKELMQLHSRKKVKESQIDGAVFLPSSDSCLCGYRLCLVLTKIVEKWCERVLKFKDE